MSPEEVNAKNTATITFEGPTGKKIIIHIAPVEDGVIEVKNEVVDGPMKKEDTENLHTVLHGQVMDLLTNKMATAPAPEDGPEEEMGKVITMGAPKGEA